MSYICPVCNGLQELDIECPVCSQQMNDCGKWSDYLGPYSPYREIDDISMSDGTLGSKNNQCLHLVNCADCHQNFTIQITS